MGDVTIDNTQSPQCLRVRLKRSKTDQLGNGVDVFVGKTNCVLCPVAGVTAYMTIRGADTGPFFRFANGDPLTKPKFTHRVRLALQVVGLPYQDFAGHNFQNRSSHSSSMGRNRGFDHTSHGPLEQLCLSLLHQTSKGTACTLLYSYSTVTSHVIVVVNKQDLVIFVSFWGRGGKPPLLDQ